MLNRFIILFLFLTIMAYGQDPSFTHFSNNPMYFNPAFTGIKEGSRIFINDYKQWAKYSTKFNYCNLAFDYKSYNNEVPGLGIIAVNDLEGDGGLSTTQLGGLVSYGWQANKKLLFQGGISASYVNRRIDWNKFIFSDQLLIDGNIKNSNFTPPPKNSTNYIDFTSGMLFEYFTKTPKSVYQNNYGEDNIIITSGYAIHHPSRPNQSITSGTSRLPIRHVFHLSVDFPFNHSENIYWKTSVMYERQQAFQNILAGVDFSRTFTYNIGIWLKSNNQLFQNGLTSIIVSAGSKLTNKIYSKVSVGFSLSSNVSALGLGPNYEISLLFDSDPFSKKHINNHRYNCAKKYHTERIKKTPYIKKTPFSKKQKRKRSDKHFH